MTQNQIAYQQMKQQERQLNEFKRHNLATEAAERSKQAVNIANAATGPITSTIGTVANLLKGVLNVKTK